MPTSKTCPDCGLPGERDIDAVYFQCGTVYKAESDFDGGYVLYGPLGERTKTCYEQEIDNLKFKVRRLTTEKAALINLMEGKC